MGKSLINKFKETKRRFKTARQELDEVEEVVKTNHPKL